MSISKQKGGEDIYRRQKAVKSYTMYGHFYDNEKRRVTAEMHPVAHQISFII